MLEIVIVEESPSESALVCIAIALRRPGTRVSEVRSMKEAAERLCRPDAPRTLVILGWRALQQAVRPCIDKLQAHAVVGFGSDLGEVRPRALDLGVRQIYERPSEWKAFVQSVETMLRDWMLSPAAALAVTRKGE